MVNVDPVSAIVQNVLITDVGKDEIEHSSTEVAPIDDVVVPPVHCERCEVSFAEYRKHR